MNSQKWPFQASFMAASKAAFLLVVALVLFMAGSQNVYAGTVAQSPLFIALSGVNPNIMFILDDSGSMTFEIMPDDYTHGTYSNGVFPRASKVHGDSDYASTTATLPNDTKQGKPEEQQVQDEKNAYGALVRSSTWNKIFYNPAVTYKPWKKHDGSDYPNAVPSAAFHNPYSDRQDKGTRDLTASTIPANSTKWYTCKSDGKCTGSSTHPNESFRPATYFTYDTSKGAAGKWTYSNYTKTEIKSSITSYSGEGREKRTDCTSGICTYAQEIQNFANWYTYYRSRALAARAGVGKAFSEQGEDLRIGFGAINKGSTTVDGRSTSTIITGVRDFKYDSFERIDFFNKLYGHPIPNSGTPLRTALNNAGKYFTCNNVGECSKGPWSDIPGAASGISYGCRRSYTILMTDGYWNDDTSPVGNADNTDGPSIKDPDNNTYQYKPAAPFKDGHSNTLADVAMYYWQRDLVPDSILQNRVPTSEINPAFWQHMVTFGVGLGVEGKIKREDAFHAITNGGNGKDGKAISWDSPTSSNAAKIDDLLHAGVNSRGGFFSAADPDTFATELSNLLVEIVAREVMSGSAAAMSSTSLRTDTDTFSYQAKFDSSNWSGIFNAYKVDKTLGTIASTPTWSTDNSGTFPAHNARKIYTMVGTQGKSFEWGNLSTAQKTALKTLNATVATDTVAQQRLNWIRGDQSNEKDKGGTLRSRTMPVPGGQITRLLGDIVNSNPLYIGKPLVNTIYQTLSGYVDFVAANQTRTAMLYVGANDGMLHAFDANTGVEKFAYIPNALFPDLSKLTDQNYKHQYYVDGAPVMADVYLGGAWKSILVGTTGAGGRAVFALDVTDPDTFDANKVLWEFTDADLGYTIGKPTIGQLKDGTWVAVFGNGYSSTNGKPYLFIVNLATGAQIAKIGTTPSLGSASDPNGLAEPAVLPDASDGKMIAAYAGDLKGNMFKFDLASKAFKYRLFEAKNAANDLQPITAAPAIVKHPDGAYAIIFGTGKYFETDDHGTGGGTQSVYGILDKGTAVGGRSVLAQQTILGESNTAGNQWRMVSQNPVGASGWYLDLSTAPGERVVNTPVVIGDRAIFTTRIPIAQTDKCVASTGESWVMAIDWRTGGRTVSNAFDVDRDGKSSASDYITVGGITGTASGSKSITAGMSQATLMKGPTGIQVVLSGTGKLSTTASSTAEANKATTDKVTAATVAAAVAKEQAAAKDKAVADAAAAQAALDKDPNNQELKDANTKAQAAKTAAEAAAKSANSQARQAIIDAAQAIIDAAQAIITANKNDGVVSVADAQAVKDAATAVKAAASNVKVGDPVPASVNAASLPGLAAQLQGENKVSTPLIIESSRQSWQQLQ